MKFPSMPGRDSNAATTAVTGPEKVTGIRTRGSFLMDETRYHGTEDLQEYLRGSFPRLDQERLSLQARMEETMFLGLRLTRGSVLRSLIYNSDALFGMSMEKYPQR